MSNHRGKNRADARKAPLGALVAFVGLFAAACAVSAPTPAPSLAEQLPVPSGAVLDIGQDGPGYDGEATFVTYVSQLPPDEAFASYDSQLLQAGFARDGQDGAWMLFSRGTLTIAVSVPDQGPPTTIIVRMRNAKATDAASAEATDHKTPPGQDPDKTPPGKPDKTTAAPAASATDKVKEPPPPHPTRNTAAPTPTPKPTKDKSGG